jgi:uncharacterized protein YicC (UPF0701 family)
MEDMEFLKATLAEMKANLEKVEANRKAEHEALKEMIDASHKKMMAEMRTNHQEMMAMLNSHYERMMACLGKTDALDLKANPEEREPEAEQREVPKKDAIVKPV